MTDTAARRAARARRAAGTAFDFDGTRLALARRLARLPRTQLAQASGVSAAAITQFERNQARPSAPALAELALALGVPADYFRYGLPSSALPTSAVHFRSLRSTPAASRDQASAFAELGALVSDLVEQHVQFPDVTVPEVAVPADACRDDVARAAARARIALGVPPGPVGHMVGLLEAAGVLVLRLPSGAVDPRVDAFSTLATSRPMVLLSPLKDDKARSRFDAAHELGHLVMHPDVEPGSKLREGQAQSFAAEFLMPAAEVLEDLPRRLDWQQLHVAKRRWGTSLRALVYRAHALGVFSSATYRKANAELAVQGNPEAGPLGPPESPAMLGRAADLLAAHTDMSTSELATALRLPEHQVCVVIDAGRQHQLALFAAAR